jgi:hypothetical protein
MSDILRRLSKFEAETGAGFDAAGRRVYTGPLSMYSGPREHAAQQATHDGLIADLARDDPIAHQIRMLLNRRAGIPGQVAFDPPSPAVGNVSYSYQGLDDRRR